MIFGGNMKRFNLLAFLLVTLSLLGACSIIETLTDEGPPPVISDLIITPPSGAAPLLSTIKWNIQTSSTAPLKCELDFGDGATQEIENCSQLTDAFHTYEKPGGYIVVLKVESGRSELKRSATVTVQEGGTAQNLQITKFLAKPATGSAPLVTNLEWQISSKGQTPLTCDLNFGDDQTQKVENCGQVTFAFHTFQNPGGYVITLKVSDGQQEAVSSFPVTVQAAAN
jgi:PKD repeat protein